jgi:hypothetical protein
MDGTFNVTTDKKEKIKLDSAIVHADWLSKAAHGGSDAELEVKTVFVAEGSSIEIKGTSSKGKAPGTIKGKVFNDKFVGNLPIPEKVEYDAQIGFEVKLPKHGLKMDSLSTIPGAPQIQVTKMCWDKTEVRRGDIVKLTTQFVNPLPDAQASVIIYEYSPDGHHDRVHSFPATVNNDKLELLWEFDYKHDTAQIPTEQERQKYQKHYVLVEFFFVVVVDSVRIGVGQESGKLRLIDKLDVQMVSGFGDILADKEFIFHFADGKQKKYKSDNSGFIKEEKIVPGEIIVEALHANSGASSK